MKHFNTLLLLCAISTTMNAQLVLNEALYDPANDVPAGTASGDANGDGTRDASEDEFLEFINASSSALDISGYKIYDDSRFGETPDDPRHEVPAGTVIPAGEKYLVFGGGDVSAIDGLAGVTAHTTSSGSLSMTNTDDIMTITDFEDNVLIEIDLNDLFLNGAVGQSIARTPDITGSFRHHYYIDGTRHSPGEDNGSTIFNTTLDLILNEVHADPESSIDGDANGDGNRDSGEDEFIELFNNTAQAIDISGYKYYDYRGFEASTPNHIFQTGTIIPENGVLVLFGGGTPNTTPNYFGDAIVQVVSDQTQGLSLSNRGDNIFIEDASENVVFVFDSSELGVSFGENQSVTRDPDITGDFVLHTSTASGLLFSPGLKTDGTVLSLEDFAQLGLNIYPNPVRDGIVHIQSTFMGVKTVELYDLTGRQVMKTEAKSEVLNVSSIKSGLYLLKVTTSEGSATSKLIIK